jgi:hypothetical protein
LPKAPPSASDRIESAEALRAGEQATVWTVVRRELARAPHPDAAALADAAEAQAIALRMFRAGSAERPLVAIETDGSTLRTRIQRTSLINPVINAQFERLDALGVATGAVPAARGSASPAP